MNRILRPIAAGFRLGVALRHAAYRRGWFKTRRLNRPVVSVGNLTVGGTGKTPFVACLAELFLKRGLKPSILTRGYGRRRGADIIVLDPRPGRVANPREVGDEPALLAKALPNVPIVVCADRYRGGLVAEHEFSVDVHILDDGFQHLALARDLDIVLVDVTQRLSDDILLPAGRLREPPSALERAHFVVLTRVDLADPLPVETQVKRINPLAKIFHTTTRLCRLVDVSNERIYPAGAFQGERVDAFCGVGNPKAFFADLRRWGFSVVEEASFRDHHIYRHAHLAHLAVLHLEARISPRKSRPAALVTTEKDALNISSLMKTEIPILACIIQTEVREAGAFEQALLDRLEACRTSASLTEAARAGDTKAAP